MTVGELIEMLQDFDEEAEVRLAEQPSWPFEYSIGGVIYDDAKEVVMIAEGSQLGYLSGHVAEGLGWR